MEGLVVRSVAERDASSLSSAFLQTPIEFLHIYGSKEAHLLPPCLVPGTEARPSGPPGRQLITAELHLHLPFINSAFPHLVFSWCSLLPVGTDIKVLLCLTVWSKLNTCLELSLAQIWSQTALIKNTSEQQEYLNNVKEQT